MDSYLQSASALITFLDLNVYLRYILVAIFDNSPPQHSLFQITKCGFWGDFLFVFVFVCLFFLYNSILGNEANQHKCVNSPNFKI